MNDGLTCLGGSNQPDTMKGIAEKAVPFFFTRIVPRHAVQEPTAPFF
ncbi:hypothetical protein N184_28005 [Sinorhizobium sp. GL28]|nr:hypothetical protein N184_28005 [Sinorhizobium sp. GL28]